MRPLTVLPVLAILAASPLAWAGHAVNHFPPGPTEPATALVEMATDGYVLETTRTGEHVFEVRVLHRASPFEVGGFDPWASPLGQYAEARVDVVGPALRDCPTAAACTNQGLWLHGLRFSATGVGDGCPNPQVPTDGCYPPQVLEVLDDGAGTFLRVTITRDFTPAYNGAVNFVVVIPCEEPLSCQNHTTSWTRGFYNLAKLALPLDALDAVPQPITIR